MNNFSFQNPTRLVFGKGQIAQLATLVSADKNIMITEVAKRFSDREMLLGERGNMTPSKVEEILNEVKWIVI